MNNEDILAVASKPGPVGPEDANLATELQQMEQQYEPLLPVEKKLVSWSVGLGIITLGLLVWVSYTFFPGGH